MEQPVERTSGRPAAEAHFVFFSTKLVWCSFIMRCCAAQTSLERQQPQQQQKMLATVSISFQRCGHGTSMVPISITAKVITGYAPTYSSCEGDLCCCDKDMQTIWLQIGSLIEQEGNRTDRGKLTNCKAGVQVTLQEAFSQSNFQHSPGT